MHRGEHLPIETRRKISKALKGRKKSREHRDKISEALQGRKFSPEWRAKISQGRKGKLAGKQNPNWKGGRKVDKGYIMVWDPQNPMANGDGYVFEHRKIMAETLGRSLTSEEVVHHINGDPTDNRSKNLSLFPNHGDHLKFHREKAGLKRLTTGTG